MDAIDLNFTTSIVGPPMSVTLGARTQARASSDNGLRVNLRDGAHGMYGSWLEWWLLRGGDEWVGLARRRPGRARLWLERHGLLLAGIGLFFMLLGLAALAAATLLAIG